LHQSFAEFFVAKSCLLKIKEQNKDDKELEQILKDERHFLIRKFLNDLMGKQQLQQINLVPNKRDFNEEIANCCRENLLSLLKYFIEGKVANLNNKNEFVTIASEKGHQEIVQMLLQNQEVLK
jgi:hypothetical protein